MKALLPSGRGDLVEFGDVDQPVPGPGEALIRVEAFSVNRGETFLLEKPPAGWRPGKDIAGLIAQGAADGSGPAAGSRVGAHPPASGWAEYAVVATDSLAELPGEIPAVTAAALPLAGLTALRMLRVAGDVTGRRILLTGASGGVGHAVEFAGEAVRALPMEARMSLCNLSVEFGARFGFIAPDETAFAYLKGRPYAPKGELWDLALRSWRALPSDPEATFDREIFVNASGLTPQITWGVTLDDVVSLDGIVPHLGPQASAAETAARQAALDYMGLEPGAPLAGTPIQHVFIGSCANSRLSDLRAAAAVVAGRHVAPGVRAMVVPGSQGVKRAAEALGLDRVFREAGFQWREPGCSMCVAMNGDIVPSGERCVSTSNRNFVGRQGPGARTHLASPMTAAASAILGCIGDAGALG